MLPHCVQTSVVDLGPRCSGLSFRKKPSCMCCRGPSSRSHSDGDMIWQQESVEVPRARDCGFRMAGTSVRLWGGSVSGAAATPFVLPAHGARASGYYFWCVATCRHSQSQHFLIASRSVRHLLSPLIIFYVIRSFAHWSGCNLDKLVRGLDLRPPPLAIDSPQHNESRACCCWHVPVVSLFE